MKKQTLFYPFLFALYPAVFLYSLNIHEYTEESLLLSSLFSLIFAGIVFFVTKQIFKRLEEAAIITSFICFVFLSYQRFLDYTKDFKIKLLNINISNEFIVLAITIFLLVGLLWLVKKYKTSLAKTTKPLFYVSLFLLVIPLFNIILFEAKTGRLWTKKTSIDTSKEMVKKTSNTPDIYYFIFDRYAGPKSLETEYDFDNSKFFNFLKDRGFYLANDSTTNYPKTFLSLASSLNMEYLDELTLQTKGGASPDESLATPLIRNSKVLNFLKERGYYTVNIGPKTWTPTSQNPFADKSFVIKQGTYPFADVFTTNFLNTTAASSIFKTLFKNPLDVSADPNNNEHRRIALFEFDAIKNIPETDSPKFVFVHILLPHDPFVFDKNCNPISEEEVNKNNHVYNYLQQLQCANTKIEDAISYILKNSKNPPIIIVQSDEGPFPMKEPINDAQAWSKASDTALREKFPILNAYLLPSSSESATLYQTITPVNSFRVLFNTYFGTNFELLEDKNYIFEDEQNYYKFTDVSDRIK